MLEQNGEHFSLQISSRRSIKLLVLLILYVSEDIMLCLLLQINVLGNYIQYLLFSKKPLNYIEYIRNLSTNVRECDYDS